MVEKSPEKYYPYYAMILVALAFVVLLLTLLPYYQPSKTNITKGAVPTIVKKNHIINQQFGIEFDIPTEFTQIGPYPNSVYTFSAGDIVNGTYASEIYILVKPRKYQTETKELLNIETSSPSGLPPKSSDFSEEIIGRYKFFRNNEENFEGQSQLSYYLLSNQYLYKFNLRLDIGEKWLDPTFKVENEQHFGNFKQLLNSVNLIN